MGKPRELPLGGLHGFVTNAARTALNASRDHDRQSDLISRAEEIVETSDNRRTDMSADDDKAWQEVIDEAVARGCLFRLGSTARERWSTGALRRS
jgi:hypothetical protein